MIITFAGHSFVPCVDKVKEAVKAQLRVRIAHAEKVSFYLGGRGGFDELCAICCRELKKEHSGIEVVYVAPCFNPSEQAKIKEMQCGDLYDSSIYPPLERVPPRLAILKRNEWMMSRADLVIAYVTHNYGGAYQALRMAQRQGKLIMNVSEFVQRQEGGELPLF